MKEKDFFNQIAESWDATNDSSTPEKVNAVLDKAEIGRGHRILDIGTGTGILLPYLASRVGAEGSITAVDLAENMLERAKNKYEGLTPTPTFLLANIEEEAVEGRYDRIMLYCVYPHIHNPEQTLRRLAENNLAPGGRIIIAHPTGRDFINNVHHERPIHSEGLAAGTDVKAQLSKAGLHTDIIADDANLYILAVTPGF
ncbi:MAG: class I SAM-dependent methyltransferase [Bacteroidales bacterium]|nr:class I SAM-dependent methyltransferase [Bacteroidales bacterium]